MIKAGYQQATIQHRQDYHFPRGLIKIKRERGIEKERERATER